MLHICYASILHISSVNKGDVAGIILFLHIINFSM